ncbi:MAG: hypothetical protein H6Q91_900 [Deltaproteobacteria bacterium]|nr:hypothetical protein [Deltaproteobacteria bacterium]
MTRNQHDWVPLGVFGHLLEPEGLDRDEDAPEHRGDEDVQHREEGRVHVRRDLAEHLLGIGARGFGGATALARAFLDRDAHARAREHGLLDFVARAQRGPLDNLLLAVQEDQDRAADLARDGVLTLGAPFLHEARQVDRIGDLDGEVVIVHEERGDLCEVRGSRGCAVGEVQEAPFGARSRSPEQRERNDRHGCRAVPRRAHRFREHVEIGSFDGRDVAPPEQPRGEPLGAQEHEQRRAALHLCANAVEVRFRERAAAAAQRAQAPDQRLPERLVVVEADAVGEGREAQSVAQEEPIEEEVVEPARVTHHVDDAAGGLERAQSRDGGLVEGDLSEEASREPAEEEIEARRHRRQRIAKLGGRHGRQDRSAGLQLP